jgi:flagellar motor switch/type III secretory pathway protein FliN
MADTASELTPRQSAEKRVDNLPVYSRSLLKIRVPVVVTLADKRQRLQQIVDLGPGSIIQFNKSCDEMLDLYVGRHRVAQGEAVKVGDKFGLRVTSVVLPGERFRPIQAVVAPR